MVGGGRGQGRVSRCFFPFLKFNITLTREERKASENVQMFLDSWESLISESIIIICREIKWEKSHPTLQWHFGHMTKCGVSLGPGSTTERTEKC